MTVCALLLGVSCEKRRPTTDEAPPARAVVAGDAAVAVPDTAAEVPAPTPGVIIPDATLAGCAARMTELRRLRDRAQPCARMDDCTVWRTGKFWDRCPTEVNVTTAARLDELRRQVEADGCSVETNAECAARLIVGCVKGFCGPR